MSDGLKQLLAGIVDFAGTFPPARLSLEDTVSRYLRYRREEQSWMLGRLVCSVDQLGELGALLDSRLAAEVDLPLPLSLVVGRSEDPLDADANLKRDAGQIAAFCTACGTRANIEAVEVRLAHRDVQSLALITPQLANSLLPSHDHVEFFYEIPPGEQWEQQARILFAHLEHYRTASAEPASGFKFRMGGLDSAAFPAPQCVARVIAACRDAGIRWKATAGLHHPLYHRDESLGVMMHGFLNVACASVLAAVRALGEEQIAEILREPAFDAFTLDDSGLRWRDMSAATAEITSARRDGFVAFGSCSFDEPVADLTSLGFSG